MSEISPLQRTSLEKFMAWCQSAFTARLDLRELAHSKRQTRASRLARVLSVGDHTDLLTYRAQVLKTAGYRVRSSVPCDACNLVSAAFYHVVVFGHSLPARECAQLATAIRGVSPETKLLLLNGFEPRALSMEQLFDTTLHCLEGPAALVSAVQGLLASTPNFRSTSTTSSNGEIPSRSVSLQSS